jgi:hypothetical protein
LRRKGLRAEKASDLVKQCFHELIMSDSSLTKNELAVKAIEMAKRKAFLEDAGRLEMQTKSPPETKPGVRTRVCACVVCVCVCVCVGNTSTPL